MILLAWVVLAVLGVVCLVLGRFVFPDDPPARIFYAVGFLLLGIALIVFVFWLVGMLSVAPPAVVR